MPEVQQTKYSTIHKKLRVEKKKKSSYYINSGLQTKGPAKRVPSILTYMYFIQREN